jgi:septum formation protein
MSLNILELLNIDTPIILASKSPRRKALLEKLGFTIEIIPADIDEDSYDPSWSPAEVVKYLAREKAAKIMNEIEKDAIIISADTVVVLDGKILNKPENEEQANSMLKSLSDREHIVNTGIAVARTKDKKVLSDVQTTKVRFRELSDKEIHAYIKSGSPMDKAGAYGIQDDFGSVFVSNIEGCYYNIVGLPLELLYRRLRDIADED